jgi:large subunit ribosomal protein L46
LISRRCSTEVGTAAGKGRRVLKVGDKRDVILKRREINAAHEAKANEMGLDFRIVSASILHRYPIITKDMLPWEVEKNNMDMAIADKQSEYFNKLIEGTDAAKLVSEEQMGSDDILKTLPFTPASRVTEADLSGDRKSNDRKLQESLFLLVKRNRSTHEWQFPQGKRADNESLRQTAERVGDRAFGKVDRWYISNVPMGHLVYAYPPDVQQQRKQYGAKVFFYRCQLISDRSFKLETRLYKDFAWVSRDEVGEFVDAETAEYLKEILVE